jgi:tetratricopeptide (TPR) repeat protein
LPYLSPEQVQAQTSGIDLRSDIYSLGIVLYELLVGERPYPVDGERSTALGNILERQPLAPRKALARKHAEGAMKVSEVNDDLEKIVLKALEKEPARRYQSVDAFADDLGRFLSGDAVHAKSTSRLYLLRKTIRKFRIGVAITAAFVLLITAALITVAVAWQRAERVAQIAMAGLDTGSLLKLGSVERDAGRIDQAIAMFEKVIETADTIRSNDPLIQRQLFNAHHRLGEIYFETKRAQLATPHVERAVHIAHVMVRASDKDPEWKSQLAFAYILEGRLAFAREASEDALASFARAASLQRDLLALEPLNATMHADLAYILGLQGWSARSLNRHDEALRCYTDSHAIYLDLHSRDPGNPSRAINLIRAENKLAAWHLAQDTKEHDDLALHWLNRAADRLGELGTPERSTGRELDINTLWDAVRKNKHLIERRTELRAAERS